MLAQRMVARLSEDKAAKRLPSEFDPELVVPIIATYLQGLWRMALVSYDRSRFEQQIDMFLSGLVL